MLRFGAPDPEGTLESAINGYMNHGKKSKDGENLAALVDDDPWLTRCSLF